MAVSIGIDVGSRTIEIVALEGDEIVFRTREETSFDYLEQVKVLLADLNGDHIIVTGYGRHLVSRELGVGHLTEIKAHAAGVHYLFPEARSILDIGGQDTKAISMDEAGRVVRFEMNDRCAAGTGRFLEVMAQALGCTVGELSDLAKSGNGSVSLSSMCTVFVETEVVALRARGVRPEDVARALVLMVAKRSISMLKRVGMPGDVAFCGGVARNKALVEELERTLERRVLVPTEPDFTGALGAALLASAC